MTTTYNTHRSLSIQKKVVLITGAFGLIGKMTAISFLEQGAFVVLADNNATVRPEIEKEISARFSSERYLFQLLDITQKQSCRTAIDAIIAKFGKLDVLINNAAIDAKFDAVRADFVDPNRFENYPEELLRNSVDTNLTGTILITQAACSQMIRQKSGNIINVASTYSMVAPNQNLYDFGDGNQKFKPVDYIASKSFIPNFTRYVATFYGREGIRCNAIVPHGILNGHNHAFLDNFSKLSPMGRMCNREELIGPFTFLASDASSYMTGSLLTVDGGWTAW